MRNWGDRDPSKRYTKQPGKHLSRKAGKEEDPHYKDKGGGLREEYT